MLHFFIFVVARPDTIFHDSIANVVAAAPFDQVIAERARLGQDTRIVQIPGVVFAIITALVVAVIPAAIAAVPAPIQMPSGRQRDE